MRFARTLNTQTNGRMSEWTIHSIVKPQIRRLVIGTHNPIDRTENQLFCGHFYCVHFMFCCSQRLRSRAIQRKQYLKRFNTLKCEHAYWPRPHRVIWKMKIVYFLSALCQWLMFIRRTVFCLRRRWTRERERIFNFLVPCLHGVAAATTTFCQQLMCATTQI